MHFDFRYLLFHQQKPENPAASAFQFGKHLYILYVSYFQADRDECRDRIWAFCGVFNFAFPDRKFFYSDGHLFVCIHHAFYAGYSAADRSPGVSIRHQSRNCPVLYISQFSGEKNTFIIRKECHRNHRFNRLYDAERDGQKTIPVRKNSVQNIQLPDQEYQSDRKHHHHQGFLLIHIGPCLLDIKRPVCTHYFKLDIQRHWLAGNLILLPERVHFTFNFGRNFK